MMVLGGILFLVWAALEAKNFLSFRSILLLILSFTLAGLGAHNFLTGRKAMAMVYRITSGSFQVFFNEKLILHSYWSDFRELKEEPGYLRLTTTGGTEHVYRSLENYRKFLELLVENIQTVKSKSTKVIEEIPGKEELKKQLKDTLEVAHEKCWSGTPQNSMPRKMLEQQPSKPPPRSGPVPTAELTVNSFIESFNKGQKELSLREKLTSEMPIAPPDEGALPVEVPRTPEVGAMDAPPLIEDSLLNEEPIHVNTLAPSEEEDFSMYEEPKVGKSSPSETRTFIRRPSLGGRPSSGKTGSFERIGAAQEAFSLQEPPVEWDGSETQAVPPAIKQPASTPGVIGGLPAAQQPAAAPKPSAEKPYFAARELTREREQPVKKSPFPWRDYVGGGEPPEPAPAREQQAAPLRWRIPIGQQHPAEEAASPKPPQPSAGPIQRQAQAPGKTDPPPSPILKQAQAPTDRGALPSPQKEGPRPFDLTRKSVIMRQEATPSEPPSAGTAAAMRSELPGAEEWAGEIQVPREAQAARNLGAAWEHFAMDGGQPSQTVRPAQDMQARREIPVPPRSAALQGGPPARQEMAGEPPGAALQGAPAARELKSLREKLAERATGAPQAPPAVPYEGETLAVRSAPAQPPQDPSVTRAMPIPREALVRDGMPAPAPLPSPIPLVKKDEAPKPPARPVVLRSRGGAPAPPTRSAITARSQPDMSASAELGSARQDGRAPFSFIGGAGIPAAPQEPKLRSPASDAPSWQSTEPQPIRMDLLVDRLRSSLGTSLGQPPSGDQGPLT